MDPSAARRKSKLASMLRLPLVNFTEFRDRLINLSDVQLDRFRPKASLAPLDPERLLDELRPFLGDLKPFLREPRLVEIENEIRRGQRRLRPAPSVEAYHDADLALGRLCYALCRRLVPDAVLETGVGSGVTSAFFLQALAVNNKGTLRSIDLPPIQAREQDVGALIPQALRSRWLLTRGRTRTALPEVLRQLPSVDLFLHDSLHSYTNLRWELETVWPMLAAGGVVLADDIQSNRAFQHFVERAPNIEFYAAAHEPAKAGALFGIAIRARSLSFPQEESSLATKG
jgi:predicted O-methyltransferase YrrM